ncbi:MAG TPA: hypothetical protein VJ691_08255 [Vicinamibacterales bacterium]|nr:hypothetical protein [Vicinamibacterales bacterium]
MTTLERLDAWKNAGVITSEQHASLTYLSRREWFSLYVEIHALLYIGVISMVAGFIWTFRESLANLGHAAILSFFAALIGASFYYCFTRGLPYSHEEVEQPSIALDYVLYFGCLMFSGMLVYLEVQMRVFGGWETHLLLASIVFGALAYRFDNRFVLSLALSTLAAYLGLTLDVFDTFDAVRTHRLRFYAMGYGVFVAGLGYGLSRRGIKRHFLDVYLHVGANAFLLATLSGVPDGETGYWYLALLLPLAAALIYLGVRFDRFAFVAYGTLYGYAGISVRVLSEINSATVGFSYLVVTGSMVVIALVVLARRFART